MVIEEIATGTALFLSGTFGSLTYLTVKLASPIALFGFALSIFAIGLYGVGVISSRLTFLIFMIHGLSIAATGVFEST